MTEFILLLRELYKARRYLNNQQGQRKDPDAPDYIRFTWNDFCEEKGITRQTANSWLRKFIPAEESASGQDEYTGNIPFYWKAMQNYRRLDLAFAMIPNRDSRKRRAG
jgi:hypothetical protein